MFLAPLLVAQSPKNIELPIRGTEITSIGYVPVTTHFGGGFAREFSEIGGRFASEYLPFFTAPERVAFADLINRMREPDEPYAPSLLRLRVDLTGERAWLMDQSGHVRYLTGKTHRDYVLTAPSYNSIVSVLAIKGNENNIK